MSAIRRRGRWGDSKFSIAADLTFVADCVQRLRRKEQEGQGIADLRFLLPTSYFLLTFPPYALHRPHTARGRQDFEISRKTRGPGSAGHPVHSRRRDGARHLGGERARSRRRGRESLRRKEED